VTEYRELGGYGPVARSACSAKGEVSAPLYNEHGFLAGWHAVRLIDGQPMAFAIPLSRIETGIVDAPMLTVAAWNAKRNVEADETYTRALSYLWAAEFDGADFYWHKAVELEPANARAWYHLGFMEGKTGHPKEKIACYRKAIELDPGFAEAHYALGIGLSLLSDRAGALHEVDVLKSLDETLYRRLASFLDVSHSDTLPTKKLAAHLK
jgi:tetratricopeptide (TPR) repeat protein